MKQSGYPIAIQLSKSTFRQRRNNSFLRCTIGSGGDERNRTADPLLAKQVLSRLSYIPNLMRSAECGLRNSPFRIRVVGLPGIEPGTSRLSSVRSNRLS